MKQDYINEGFKEFDSEEENFVRRCVQFRSIGDNCNVNILLVEGS